MKKFDELIHSPVPVLVDFFAEWCGPCKAMKPILEDLKKEIGEKVRIVKIDVDKFEELALEYHIQTVPTLILFNKGEAVWRQAGVMQVRDLKKVLDEYIE